MSLTDAVRRFREVDEATTSASVGPYLKGLGRTKPAKKVRCKGYDPECRDKEWEVPAPIGGVALLRRSPARIGGV